MPPFISRILAVLFFVSGFCGLLYQIIWMRLAFASFGVIPPVVSLVVSVFMLGLSLGAWWGGKAAAGWIQKTKRSPIFLYAGVEGLIALGAFSVPTLFTSGEHLLTGLGQANSLSYLGWSALVIVLAIVPWTLCMGATFPLMMSFVRQLHHGEKNSFSFLYMANLFGALVGVLTTAGFLIEQFGFRGSLAIAGTANLAIAAASLALGFRFSSHPGEAAEEPSPHRPPSLKIPPIYGMILFATGFASLAMEIVWVRAFTPILGTQVYSFALLLFVYLLSSWHGAERYRRTLKAGSTPPSAGVLLAAVSLTAFLPVLINDPRIPYGILRPFITLFSIFPFCATLGYLTPLIIDRVSQGNPATAGRAYAINTLGCILGPLAAAYLLLPFFTANGTLVLLALPLLLLTLLFLREMPALYRRIIPAVSLIFIAIAALGSVSYENHCAAAKIPFEVRRDHVATVVSSGKDLAKNLWVNGVGITILTPITKHMSHLPVLAHQGRPESSLIICFGMGTTHRAMLSWGVKTTTVELVPSVLKAFPYYHHDAATVLENPLGRVVIDDGRRFLSRTPDLFDIVVIDPPPPIEAAGSSLLYSVEFHRAVQKHLRPGGILQTWYPGQDDESTQKALLRSLTTVFKHVRVFRSYTKWGLHYLASDSPIELGTPAELIPLLPPAALKDLEEWSGADGVSGQKALELILGSELRVTELLDPDPRVCITDDRPYNEYFLLRNLGNKPKQKP